MWVSPAGKFEIRSDPAGDGQFWASRGSRRHNGIDLIVDPGQSIFSPEDSTYLRISNPYKEDNQWHGICLWVDAMYLEVFIWYIRPYFFHKGQHISRGELIGVAQDIRDKYYPSGMLPHIHVGVKKDGQWIDPTHLFH